MRPVRDHPGIGIFFGRLERNEIPAMKLGAMGFHLTLYNDRGNPGTYVPMYRSPMLLPRVFFVSSPLTTTFIWRHRPLVCYFASTLTDCFATSLISITRLANIRRPINLGRGGGHFSGWPSAGYIQSSQIESSPGLAGLSAIVEIFRRSLSHSFRNMRIK